MRHSQAEKMEIIHLVESSALPVRRTLAEFAVPRSSFYRWCAAYVDGGYDGRREVRGDVVVVRFADDFVIGFQHRTDAERLLTELRARMATFGLELHPAKRRLLEFGRYAAVNRAARGLGKPETLNFLGIMRTCGKTRKGGFTVLRQTMRQRWQAKLKALKLELRRRMHLPLPALGRYLRVVVLGHVRYYGVPMN